MYPNYTGYYQPTHTYSLKGHPVSSFEEAQATSIDFDGSISYFPDIANKRIYTKQINPDGTSSINMYILTQLPTTKVTDNYVTREEFQKFIESLKPKDETKEEFKF